MERGNDKESCRRDLFLEAKVETDSWKLHSGEMQFANNCQFKIEVLRVMRVISKKKFEKI